MGIDASTFSIAYSILKPNSQVVCGKILLNGSDIYERMHDAKIKTREIVAKQPVDYVCIEASVAVKSISVAIKLAYVYGAIIAELMDNGTKVVLATPVQWQAFIGNARWTRQEKADYKKANPGHTASWYTTQIYKARKQVTMDFFNDKYGLEIDDDDVGDSLGLAYYGFWELTQR